MDKCVIIQLALPCLMMFVVLSHATPVNPCPGGYDIVSKQLGSCYMIGSMPVNWFDAETFCLSTGGHLVAVTSFEKLGFLREILQRKGDDIAAGVWTGGNDIAKQDSWMWVGINQPVDNDLWDTSNGGQPNGVSERCGILYKLRDYRVHDHTCDLTVYVPMCEHRM